MALALFMQAPSAAVIGSSPAWAQSLFDEDATDASIVKMNAYVEFLNSAMRASESLQRYESWVDMKKGPTGKEKIIYGLYSLYDTRSQIEAVATAAKTEPRMPDLDAAMLAYLETYQQLAPVLERANKYYERQDYKADKMEGGKAFHKEIAALATVHDERRKKVDNALRQEKVKIDLASLQGLEKAEGRKSRWHVRNVMFHAEAIMDLMPTNDSPVVDMPAFGKALDAYAVAVRDFDDYGLQHPSSFSAFESSPASLLSKLRDLDETLQKVKGDARKGGGDDLDLLVSDYNNMVTTSQTATTFAKD
ncbi:DUF3829 domain-containing protein [Rhizobium deserti]|uniref:DUF3829 domain-containing protein n=2 Tax=Rhizobium deserti TaxID=2547961 RepID=A0A4R5ULC9_9HYPH|nr:DUF3829 domain-containing protein [Rhizobium deserti]